MRFSAAGRSGIHSCSRTPSSADLPNSAQEAALIYQDSSLFNGLAANAGLHSAPGLKRRKCQPDPGLDWHDQSAGFFLRHSAPVRISRNSKAYIMQAFGYTPACPIYSFFTSAMLKNILLVFMILLPAALYLYMVSRSDDAKPPEKTAQTQPQQASGR